MDRYAQPRRRGEGGQPTTKPPVRITHGKGPSKDTQMQPATAKVRSAKDSSETMRVPKRADANERASNEGDANAKNFTVANVGRNGTLYLKPSRLPPGYPNLTPATPPGTSDGMESALPECSETRQSPGSGTFTPRDAGKRGAANNRTGPAPPVSMANVHSRRRTRSHSLSTVDNSIRSQTFDSNDKQLLLNGKETLRPKSSIDFTDGFLNLRIPHFRLGTPRFSDRGTAYLHNSLYNSISEDMRSSVFSKAEYDKLFPAPPGKDHAALNSSPYLHPLHAANSLTPNKTPPSPRSLISTSDINPAIFDKVESHISDSALVRYSPSTGRIIAATPARLVAQITSPLFLDYELLADFFLSFRNFLTGQDLLEYLMARLIWALSNNSDSGRIVRVRTFVAIRHWVLNYFADDFMDDLALRQRFCGHVNGLAQTLRGRSDNGGTDMNVIGELKKCWRRTCARFWPVPDALDTSPDSEILPGQEPPPPRWGSSSASLAKTVQRNPSKMDFRRSSMIQLPQNDRAPLQAFGSDAAVRHGRTASIPTSPMSQHSLTVLSCSVPFLKNILPSRERAARSSSKNPSVPEAPAKSAPSHAHKRSGSFSDALRDRRPPLHSGDPEQVGFQSLQDLTFTGGLVRGLLLQPSPSKVNLLIPLSPGLETQEPRASPIDASLSQDRQQVKPKRLVGDVRRALSTRRGYRESPASSQRSIHSSESSQRNASTSSTWHKLQGPARIDMLAEKIEGSYNAVFQDDVDPENNEDAPDQDPSNQPDTDRLQAESGPPTGSLPQPDVNRLNSHVTTGSRSIVIANDTGVPDMPNIGALPSVSSWATDLATHRPVHNPQEALEEYELNDYQRTSSAPTVASEMQWPLSSQPQMHDLLSVPPSWETDTTHDKVPSGYSQARKSSGAHPVAFDMPSIHRQLKRRPGGDLKAADNVHELEPNPKHDTGDSFSTFTRSLTASNVPSHDLSGTHFSGQGYRGLRASNSFAHWKRDSMTLLPTHSSQPNMRPSFAHQVSDLAHLPDRPLDGGIEDALAKLEGKPASVASSNSTAGAGGRHVVSVQPPSDTQEIRDSVEIRTTNASDDGRKSDGDRDLISPQTDRQGASIYRLSATDVGSEADEPPASPGVPPFQAEHVSDMRQLDANLDHPGEAVVDASAVKETEMVPERDNAVEPRSATPQGSFLLNDNESLSDISTEIAEQSGDESMGVRSFFFDDTRDDELVHVPSFRRPPTPPSTVGPTASVSPASPEPRSPTPFQATRSPTPHQAMSVDAKRLKEAASAPKLMPLDRQNTNINADQKPQQLRRVRTSPSRKHMLHLPFVLAFESETIAEQLTIIEKDALDEVEWKDLIGLSWQQNPPHIRNWVDFLKRESNGIDIVIARFNLVVKWVVSECLLTDAPSERARCITKYIHIAANCHRLRNYASMYQITLALLSADIARLTQTWSLVAPAEKQMLKRFEQLCQPLRNFHNLRSEMEAASTDSGGCIPFIGLYTHDLMFNAQKPARVDPTPPGREKLVNFERYQTAASIVKSLLRLIESSSRYAFNPHPEVLSRCLWLAALEDSEIMARSKELEKEYHSAESWRRS